MFSVAQTSRTGFQHTATRRWLHIQKRTIGVSLMFQHTATRRWLLRVLLVQTCIYSFNTQPPEGGCSRVYPKSQLHRYGFNTQPPEGGCLNIRYRLTGFGLFQHTATRRWLQLQTNGPSRPLMVSTHSHPKVAAHCHLKRWSSSIVSTHSHPKVAAHPFLVNGMGRGVSTHSHPKVAARKSRPRLLLR